MPVYSPRPAFARSLRLGLILCLGSLLAGCATLPVADQLDRDIRSGDYAVGLQTLEKAKDQYAGPNSLLYYLDKGSLEQRVGDLAASNTDLEQAERLIEDVKVTSISESAASLLVNDTTLSYSGEDFEQVMVNVLKSLNYLYLGDLEGAGVEARKVNTRLLQLSDKYAGQAVYKEDAFARYLSAFIYEAGGDYNDAYIDYKQAWKDFQWYAKHFQVPVPTFLAADLLRLARGLGYDDEVAEWQQQFPDQPLPPARLSKRTELLLVIYDGRMLAKRTRFVEAPVREPDGDTYLLKVAFPTFRMHPPAVAAAALTLPSGVALTAQVLEPLAEIAVQNLEQRIGLITVKAIARATAKYLATYQIKRATGGNFLVGLAANIYTLASEQADTRSWRTLPFRFAVVRTTLPAGPQTLVLTLEPVGGGGPRQLTLTVDLKVGEKKVLPVYVPE